MSTLSPRIRPEYSTTLPSTGKKIKYSPFTVKEEKVLVLAAESREPNEMANAITNIIQNCVTSPPDLNVNDLALFDIEFLFLKARAKSVGEDIKLKITDPEDETFTTEQSINIDRLNITHFPGHSNLIEIDENTKVKMKYPGIDFFIDGLDLSDISKQLGVVKKCISQIIIGEDTFNASDLTDEELNSWIESLTDAEFEKIIQFFRTMPKLIHTIKIKNPETKKTFEVKLEGLGDFFG